LALILSMAPRPRHSARTSILVLPDAHRGQVAFLQSLLADSA